MISFTIRAVPPSHNDLRRKHWQARHSSAKEWRGLVFANALRFQTGYESARVIVTYYGPASRDADNYNVKPILDGLVDAGVMADDRWPFLYELVLRQRPAKKRDHRTDILVEAVEL